jgi:hypothetical protein
MGGIMKYQIVCTKFDDPAQKSGQHTNGKPNLFIREDDTCPWWYVEEIKSAHKVRCMIEEMGFHEFRKRHCIQYGD